MNVEARDSISSVLYLERDVLGLAACARIRAAMTRGVADEAEVLGSSVHTDVETRRAASIEVDDDTLGAVEVALDARRDVLSGFFGTSLGRREGSGFLRYGTGGFYAAHRDRGDTPAWPAAAARAVSLVLFLNDAGDPTNGFEGGALHLIELATVITPAAGLLVAFRSETLHEVRPVVRGERDAVVDWFYRGAAGGSSDIQSTTTPAGGADVLSTGRIASRRSLRRAGS